MSAVLNTNTAALWAAKNLLGAQNRLAASVERLSSGLRVNRARDDAAGLGVSNSLTAQINGANQGMRNLNDAISMVQTAEGAISAASEMGQRILMLATQGANGTLGVNERTAIQDEMKQLLSSIDSIGGRTKFSGNQLLYVDADTTTDADINAVVYSMQVSNTASDIVEMKGLAFRKIGGTATGDTDAAGTRTGTGVADTVLGDTDGAAGGDVSLYDAVNSGNLVSATAATATTAFQVVQRAANLYVIELGKQRSLLVPTRTRWSTRSRTSRSCPRICRRPVAA